MADCGTASSLDFLIGFVPVISMFRIHIALNILIRYSAALKGSTSQQSLFNCLAKKAGAPYDENERL